MEENREVIEIMRDRQWAYDFEFYSKPHDHLTGKELKMALAQKERIEKKNIIFEFLFYFIVMFFYFSVIFFNCVNYKFCHLCLYQIAGGAIYL
ncbi:hypothetical protein HanIR_Chr02g0069981 [Helianthus annuus]|nr:hypothetical protein HanIR_Chr02g0069981 [Helianthus annuus]